MEQIVDTLIITQARLGSTRLPGKVLLEIEGEALLKTHLTRISQAKLADKVMVATTTEDADHLVAEKAASWGYSVFRGDENDVLDRFYQACLTVRPKWVVRVTSDCPLIDPNIIDAVIAFAKVNDVDYGANILVEHFPDGQDVEVFKFEALEEAWKKAELKSEREHVTPYIRKNADFNGGDRFKAVNVPCQKNYSGIRMTVDEQRDFDLVKILIEKLGREKNWLEYTHYIIDNQLTKINDSILRNEGYQKSLKND